MHDIVKELGFLTLGTRLRRLGESLQSQTQALLTEHGIELPAAHFPLLAALDRFGPLSVGELAQAVGVKQPVVSRSLLGLQASALVESTEVAGDRRARSIRLSRQGRELVAHAKREAWPRVQAAVAQACALLQGDLLAQLAGLEEALAHTPLRHRPAPAESTPVKPRHKPRTR